MDFSLPVAAIIDFAIWLRNSLRVWINSCISVGKLFLAADDPLRVRSYATRTGLTGHTKNSLTQLPVLERDLSKVRQYGFARDNEELELGVRCMAAGIYDDQGKLVAGLSISAPAERLEEAWLPKLQDTAKEISASLGHRAEAFQQLR